MSEISVAEIKDRLAHADEQEFEVLERSLVADSRKGVLSAIRSTKKRLEREKAERERLASMYGFETGLKRSYGSKVLVGLDEVGRGPLAGPLCVGAVILDHEAAIDGLNDSKQIAEAKRKALSSTIKESALAYSIEFVPPKTIDDIGMTKSLKLAFASAVKDLEDKGFEIDLILLDGNPLHFDEREVNIVKGDARCPSIAAASIIAKVARDEYMTEISTNYPNYSFEENKGYGTEKHRCAIREYGLTDVHRVTFCHEFMQQSLF